MKIGYLFPGQGSQYVGMGKDLYDKYDQVKELYDNASNLTGIDIKEISFIDSDNKLNETKYTQLAILLHSLSILEVLKSYSIKCDMSTGLSLGEYSALINALVIDKNEGINLVKMRGEFMQDLIPDNKYLMAAVLGLEDNEVEDVCSSFSNVYPANYNTFGQIVISGYEEEVNKAIEVLKDKGARVMPLKTSGPFHTELLIDSSNALKSELSKIKFNKFNNLVVRNIDGEIYKDNDDMVDILSKHIISSVRFTKSIVRMLDEGIDTFIEIGPGKTLSNLVKKTALKMGKSVEIFNISDSESLESVVSKLKENGYE